MIPSCKMWFGELLNTVFCEGCFWNNCADSSMNIWKLPLLNPYFLATLDIWKAFLRYQKKKKLNLFLEKANIDTFVLNSGWYAMKGNTLVWLWKIINIKEIKNDNTNDYSRIGPVFGSKYELEQWLAQFSFFPIFHTVRTVETESVLCKWNVCWKKSMNYFKIFSTAINKHTYIRIKPYNFQMARGV